MAIKFKIDEKKEELKKEYEAKGEKAPKKLKIKKPKRQKLATLALIISGVITLLVIAYVALPSMSIIFGVIGFTAFGIIIMFPTIITLGFVWMSEGWRMWVKNLVDGLTKFIASGGEAASKMVPAFPYIAAFGGAIIIGNFVFNIHIKKHPDLNETGVNTRFAGAILLLTLYIIFLIIDSVLIATGAYH